MADSEVGDLDETTTPAAGDETHIVVGGVSKKATVGNLAKGMDLSDMAGGELADLSDVGDTTATDGRVLRANGTSWVSGQLAYSDLSGTPTIPTAVSELTNDAGYLDGTTGVEPGDNVSTLTNDAGYLSAITAESLADLSNVGTDGTTNGNLLEADGDSWESVAKSSIGLSEFNADIGLSDLSSGQLSDLSDVGTTTPTAGNVLRGDGDSWESADLDGDDVTITASGEQTGTDAQAAIDNLNTRLTDNFVQLQRDRVQIPENFYGTGVTTGLIGEHGWTSSVSGTGAAITAGVGGFGILPYRNLSTGTTTTGRCRIDLGVAMLQSVPTGTAEWDITVGPNLSDGTDTYAWWVGLHDAGSSQPTDGFYFEYDHGTHGDHNLRACSADGGTRTKVDTGIAMVADAAHQLTVVMDGADAVFYIDGTQVATITTNQPDAGDYYGPAANILKSAGTNARFLIVNRFVLDIERP